MELGTRRAKLDAPEPGPADASPARRQRADDPPHELAPVVLAGLRACPKRLPPWMLYDDAGSALFEEITELPQYYLTRTERAILTAHAPAIMAAAGWPAVMVELGAGSASKTRLLLEAWLARQRNPRYVPVDVSPALGQVAAELRAELPGLKVTPVAARYPEELDWLPRLRGPRLVLFLGSSIGNYDRTDALALLRALRAQLAPGDGFLLGTDLVKPADVLVPAYDDPAGVTARFNLNLLERLNRELGAHFDLEDFAHHVRWNAEHSRMELYLRSLSDQLVAIDGLGITVRFARGELLHTENSHKFTVPGVRALLDEAGFDLETTWTDARRWFALHLARV
jgi:dimethylhistidine N-methyltransferase